MMSQILMPHQFWRGTLGEAEEVFSTRTPRGEITVLVERKENSPVETPSESQLEDELRDLISNGHSLSTVTTSFRVYRMLFFFTRACISKASCIFILLVVEMHFPYFTKSLRRSLLLFTI